MEVENPSITSSSDPTDDQTMEVEPTAAAPSRSSTMSATQKIDIGNKYKLQANQLVAAKEYKKACQLYRRVFGCVKGIVVQDKAEMARFTNPADIASSDEKKAAIELLSSVYSNLALCYLKLNDAKRAMESARESINLEPKNAKAQLRMGIACTELKMWAKAKQALLAAHALEPNDAMIKKEIGVFKAAAEKWEQEQKQNEKNAFGGKLL